MQTPSKDNHLEGLLWRACILCVKHTNITFGTQDYYMQKKISLSWKIYLGLGNKAVLDNNNNYTSLHYCYTLSFQESPTSSTFWTRKAKNYAHSQDEENEGLCFCKTVCEKEREMIVTLINNSILMKRGNLQQCLMLLKMKNAEKWKMFSIPWAFTVAAFPLPHIYCWITVVWWAISS